MISNFALIAQIVSTAFTRQRGFPRRRLIANVWRTEPMSAEVFTRRSNAGLLSVGLLASTVASYEGAILFVWYGQGDFAIKGRVHVGFSSKAFERPEGASRLSTFPDRDKEHSKQSDNRLNNPERPTKAAVACHHHALKRGAICTPITQYRPAPPQHFQPDSRCVQRDQARLINHHPQRIASNAQGSVRFAQGR